MKKTVLTGAISAIAMFGFASTSFAYDLEAECHSAVDAAAAEQGIEADYTGCGCILENTTDAITASFEAAGGNQDAWSQEAKDLVAQCFPQAE